MSIFTFVNLKVFNSIITNAFKDQPVFYRKYKQVTIPGLEREMEPGS